MGKTINNKTSEQIIQRLMKLQPGMPALWGSLSVEGMMFHCTFITNEILSAQPLHDKPRIKQRITKIVGLYIMNKFPKGVKSAAKYVSKDPGLDFEKERKTLIGLVNKISSYIQPIYGRHPFFGPMQTKDWHRFLYKHLDHHLRQFGV